MELDSLSIFNSATLSSTSISTLPNYWEYIKYSSKKHAYISTILLKLSMKLSLLINSFLLRIKSSNDLNVIIYINFTNS